ncbi:MAG: peptidylprolyl isomerase [Acidimicrobiia bacterium]|nr:peptidylprolyl isomerase [Acidimicrobiia bacterium]
MKRTFSLLLLGALAVLPACSSTPGVAATINGHDISTKDVSNDVSGFAKSSEFRSALAQQGVTLTQNGSVPKSFAAQWLVSLIQNEAVALVAKKRGVSATAQEIAAARTQFGQSQQSGKAFKQLPKTLQDRLVEAAALQSALRASLKPSSPYAALQADCPTQRLIGHILVDTPEKAQQVIDQIKNGASFTDVSAQMSSDTGANSQGGLLMCEGSSQWTQLDATFRAGAEATPTGGLSEPIKTQFGYHVIEALPLTEENAAPLLPTVQTPDPLAPILTKYLTDAKIYVNPLYGKLRRQGGQFTIEPPAPKPVKSRPSATTSTSAPAATAPTAPTAPASGGTSSTSTP